MSILYLCRHGQASFAAADYDMLSELGRTQSSLLGVYLTSRGNPERGIDALYCGPLRRQRDTAAHFIAAAREAGHPCPDVVVRDELLEYPAEAVIRHLLPELLQDPELAAWLAREGVADPLRNPRAFQRVFELAMGRWVRSEIQVHGAESFAAFAARVRRGLSLIMAEQGRGRRVAVITSAGPVAAAMQMALGVSDEMTLKLSWVVANSAITEMHYREHELTLTTFNTTPHLPRRDLLTYR